jgi:cephalosporin hydroxylase
MKKITRLFKSSKSYLMSVLFSGKYRKGRGIREKFSSIEKLTEKHFEFNPEHPCRFTLTAALIAAKFKPVTIIETGTSAWGANSTMLFDSYVNSFGGSVNSVDIRAAPMFKLINKCTNLTTMHCNDSLKFLSKLHLSSSKFEAIKIFYFDSMDVNWSDPISSMTYGLSEFLTVLPLVNTGDIVLVDDTPINEKILKYVQGTERADAYLKNQKYGVTGGKGSLIKDYVNLHGSFEILQHDYQLLLKKR